MPRRQPSPKKPRRTQISVVLPAEVVPMLAAVALADRRNRSNWIEVKVRAAYALMKSTQEPHA